MGPLKGFKGEAALAYTAGIVDGEGSICLVKRKRSNIKRPYAINLSVSVGNTSEWLIYWLKMQYGGSISQYIPVNDRCRPVWRWQLNYGAAVEFLKLIIPYLQIKKPQAELAIQFQSHKKMGPHNEEITVIEEAQRLLMQNYNKGETKNVPD